MASIIVETSVPISVLDRVRLFADIYRPWPSGRYLVLVQRTRSKQGLAS